ncbi:DUF7146 domain-containing protein [Sulfitobacter dubius]|uniref:DUF7146 domain-containing protein n=1 Tax=Sulfitobacter dubius TaxID=218673 RepID=UPI0030D7F7BE
MPPRVPDRPEDPRLEIARAEPIKDLADRLGLRLMRAGREWQGACPGCGGRDRFAVVPAKNAFFCRQCQAAGDQIDLVRLAHGCDFKAALSFLGGAAASIDPAELARRREKAEAEAKRQAEIEERARARAKRDAREIWTAAKPGPDPILVDYLAARGLRFDPWPKSIRFDPAAPYKVKRAAHRGGNWETLHAGPAMVAAVQGPDGKFSGVHRTWIDPARPGQKMRLAHPDSGDDLKSKLTRGSIKGGAIRLTDPPGASVMVMGEGIETTATAWISGAYPGAAFWAGVSLGNMAGMMRRAPGGKPRWSGLPDMSDEGAFFPPPGLDRLIYLEDGDSSPAMTRASVLCGLRRAQLTHPRLRGAIVTAGEGRDLNDLLREETGK